MIFSLNKRKTCINHIIGVQVFYNPRKFASRINEER
jgi:hypothetical protein